MSSIDPLNLDIAYSAPTIAKPDAANGDFASLFSQSMLSALTENTLATAGGTDSSPPMDADMGLLQSSLLAQAANGQASGKELMLYMMMSMMQEFQGSDLSPLISAMSAALPSLTTSDGTSTSAPGLTSANSGSIVPGLSLTSASNRAARSVRPTSYASNSLPQQAWQPASSRYTSTVGRRSADSLSQVLSQFNVESAERYRPNRNGKTYCNIFVWDATRALGCEIPHYVDKASGNPRAYPDVAGAYELDANGTCDWLAQRGTDFGWREVSAAAAQYYANTGYPTVSAWRNESGRAGHVAMVCPSQDGAYNPKRGVTVAQAGGNNFAYAHIDDTMSADKIAQTHYYVHA